MLKLSKCFLSFCCISLTTITFAKNISVSIPMYFTAEKGVGKSAGMIMIQQTDYGLLFSLDVHGLIPGVHKFHVDQNPSCNRFGMAAGAHLDTKHSGKHLGPYEKSSHLGDLPDLYATSEGKVPLPVLAPRIMNLDDIKNHSLVISDEGDEGKQNDIKARTMCGVISERTMSLNLSHNKYRVRHLKTTYTV